MDSQEQVKPVLGWHEIYGAPYFLMGVGENKFYIVQRTATVFDDGGNYAICLDPNNHLSGLVLGEDIEEFFPDRVESGILVKENSHLDFQIVRGLRHLARLENAFYVAYPLTNDHFYGQYIPALKRTLVLPRFFNRKYDTGIDPI